MGLDIYVGSFTRYYAHHWETVIQKAGREQGIQVETVRQPESPDAIKDPVAINSAVLQWRDLVGQSLHGAGASMTKLSWDETLDAPYFTDKPGWDCFGALLILASHEQAVVPIFSSRYPKRLQDNWQKDSRLQLATATGGRYSHLLGCEVWLPVDLPDSFAGPRPNAKPARFGSTQHLQKQLTELNQRTYGGSPDDLAAWGRNMPPGEEKNFEPLAKTGLAITLALVQLANVHGLPMVLDY